MFSFRFGMWWVAVGATCWAVGCGGTDAAGSGGAGGASSAGSGGVAGSGSGGDADGGTGGSAGGDGGMCPAAQPTLGSPCAPAGHLNCFYGGNPCCGGAYTCGTDGKWQSLGLGCACVPDAGSDSRASDAPSDVSSDAPFACGTTTCAADQFCVHPSTNLCGPAPQCVPHDDAGACPPGTMFNAFCAGSPNGGCVAIPMRGPPHCATLASTCGPSPSMCSCFPSNPCGPSGADFCQRIDGRDVSCICLAP